MSSTDLTEQIRLIERIPADSSAYNYCDIRRREQEESELNRSPAVLSECVRGSQRAEADNDARLASERISTKAFVLLRKKG